MKHPTGLRAGVIVLALVLVAAACGDDAADTTSAAAGVEAESSPTPVPGSEGTVDDTNVEGTSDDFGEVCAVAQELWEQEGLPSHSQLERYQAAAPAEIATQVDLAAGLLLDAPDGDLISFYGIFADDRVEAAIDVIDAFEEEQCGIPHSETEMPDAPGVTYEVEAGAARVDVTASEFKFEFDEPIAAGRTSFVLTNDGDQAHFLLIVKLADGVDLQAAIESDDGTGIEGQWATGLAAPGGSDEEIVTFDLEPGNYGMLCWIPGADGTPHAFSGMMVPFTVG